MRVESRLFPADRLCRDRRHGRMGMLFSDGTGMDDQNVGDGTGFAVDLIDPDLSIRYFCFSLPRLLRARAASLILAFRISKLPAQFLLIALLQDV